MSKEASGDVLAYIEYAKGRSDLDRTDLNKEKQGSLLELMLLILLIRL